MTNPHHHPFTPNCAICVNLHKPPWKPGTVTIPAPRGHYHVCDEHAATIETSGAHGNLWDIIDILRNHQNPTPGRNAT